ncbi:hypothetical protein ACIBQX_11075 [Nonomuraea sp. NPDC049714]|uniref:hypothetical protein n=1 Tax=Nonomuraea sp. NPDC049714 TaxID=3364357 RepID=UPI0037A74D15
MDEIEDFDPPRVPDSIARPLMAVLDEQDRQRGDWPSPREEIAPAPPWPDSDNPILRLLLWKAVERIKNGMPADKAMLDLAVHAWFEGGIDGYDRGQRDARRPRLVQE